MASIITAFNFAPTVELLVGTKSYMFPRNSIRSIIIDNNYDRNNMPIIYLKVRITSVLYNRLVLNRDKATISFRLFKFPRDSTSALRQTYIEDNFSYIMSSDPDYNAAYEQFVTDKSTTDNESAETYLEGFIALMSMKAIENNKLLINDIIKNSNLISIVHRYTKHMTMCIEPCDNIDTIEQHIVPPITTITDLLEWLNNNFTFYKSGYRYFRDFDMTYLLSMNGNAIMSNSTNKFDTIIFSIRDPLESIGKSNSIELDRANHAYIIYVDANNTSINIDGTVNKKYNSIIGVDSLGNTIQEALKIPETPEKAEKVLMERVYSNNLDKIYNTKMAIESTAINITITKTEVDSSIFTPNKEYQIRHYEANREYDGKYVLSYKKEMILRQDDDYIGSVLIGLRKVTEE